jgi:hypothetical protein
VAGIARARPGDLRVALLTDRNRHDRHPDKEGETPMKYFMDTHDRSKGSWPSDDISEAEFIRIYAEFGKAVAEQGGHDLGAHVNVKAYRAFCFTYGPDEDAIRRAHEKLHFPYDSITEVRRVTGVDLRPSDERE